MSSATAEADEQEAPFVYVGRRSRNSPTNRAASSHSKNVRPGNGSAISGFTYSTKSAKDVSKKTLQRAHTNVALFCDFLRPALVKQADVAASYSTQLRGTLEQVWPSDASDEDGGRSIPESIVCLGLGSPTTSRSAQIQLALLIIVREYLTAHSRRCQPPDRSSDAVNAIDCVAFDPVFSSDDKALLDMFDVRCADQEGTSSIEQYYTEIDRPTLLYMPHCDRSLYEDVLTRNTPTTVEALTSALKATTLDNASQQSAMPHVTLLANTLTNYLDSTPSANHVSIPTLSRLAPQMRAVALPNWNPTKSQQVGQIGQLWDTIALNEMSFQWL